MLGGLEEEDGENADERFEGMAGARVG